MSVDDKKKNIKDFIQTLSLSIPVIQIDEGIDMFKVDIDRAILYLYMPGALRREEENNYPVIHIDYDQLCSAPEKIINRLKGQHGLGKRVYARATVVARIDKRVALAFQEEHHLQSALPGKYRYGLFYQGDLVSVAIFSGGRIMRQERLGYRSFELIRFCHKSDTLIVGGLSKLLKAFIKDFSPQDIMTYADRDWSHNHSSLQTIGFEIIKVVAPQRFAIVGKQRFSVTTEEQQVDYYIENKGSLKLKLVL